MKKNYLKVSKTARFFTLGTLSPATKTIWFVFHGYAQTADNFLESLHSLANPHTFIIAPEGLSRFYWKDFSSKPVATWMTKLERLSDIQDNQAYLDQLYQSFQFDISRLSFNYLGFSQGTATMSRWISKDKIKADKIVFYAGKSAHDIDLSKSNNFKNAKIQFIYGQNDRFITEDNVQKIILHFKMNGLNLHVHKFDGKHKICHQGLSFLDDK